MAGMAAAAARGPLNALLTNASTQWIVIGAGIYVFGPDHLRDAIHRAIAAATAAPVITNQENAQQYRSAAPVIVRVDSGVRSGGGSRWMTIVSYTALVGGVWVSYSFLSTILPEQLQQLLPVTRRVFEKSSKSLAKTIYNVKEVLGNQINTLLHKQEELEGQQKDSHKEILNVKLALKDARDEIQTVNGTTHRCEEDLKRSIAMQGYTARGVKLLVTAVSSILAPDNRIAQELEDYVRAGDLIYGGNNKTGKKQHPTVCGPEEDRPSLTRPSTPSKKTIAPLMPTTPDERILNRIQQGKWLEATN